MIEYENNAYYYIRDPRPPQIEKYFIGRWNGEHRYWEAVASDEIRDEEAVRRKQWVIGPKVAEPSEF